MFNRLNRNIAEVRDSRVRYSRVTGTYAPYNTTPKQVGTKVGRTKRRERVNPDWQDQ